MVPKKKLTTSSKSSLPVLPSLLLSILAPKDIKADMLFIEEFNELYETKVLPAYGNRAPLWIWLQVAKTASMFIKNWIGKKFNFIDDSTDQD